MGAVSASADPEPVSAARAVTFLVVSFGFGAVFWRNIALSATDHPVHVKLARDVHAITDITWPHFLYQLLLKAGAPILDYEGTALVVLGACYGLMAVVLVREIGRVAPHVGETRACLLASLLLIASHIYLGSVTAPNLYYYYLAPTAWHNPTQQLNKLFAVVIFFAFVRMFIAPEARRHGRPEASNVRTASQIVGLALLSVLSAIAKPSFLLAFLPMSALYIAALVARGRADRPLLTAYALGVALPTLLVLAVQYVAFFEVSRQQQVIVAPFAVYTDAGKFLVRLVPTLLFPLVVTGLAMALRAVPTRMGLAWLYLAIAIVISVTLAEAGRVRSGNFLWTGQTGTFIVYVESFLLLISLEGRLSRRSAMLAFGAFAVHVACGIGYAAAAVLYPDYLWR